MNRYQRVLTIQDISCVGQCSLTVALPILSACGHETAILPSAVLSTHTAGFTGFTCRDLTCDIPAIARHWEKEKISFDAFYTGYLGSTEQIAMVETILSTLGKPGALKIIDPAMADNGKLYPAFNAVYVEAMKSLTAHADYFLPNITEASFITGIPYKETYDETYVKSLVAALLTMGVKTVVLTGVSYKKEITGVVVATADAFDYYEHKKITKGCHGTGDVYASAFVGALLAGKTPLLSAQMAADYTVACIEFTQPDVSHWYGVKFEPLLSDLIARLKE